MKTQKGFYGYIDAQRKRVILWTAILFVIAFSLFIGGYIVTGTKRNLLTIVAVLGLLPASKSLVNVIMFCRAKGCSEKVHERIQEFDGVLDGLYDLYFTSYKTNYPVSHMVLKGNVLCGLTEDGTMDTNACKKHLEDMMLQSGFKNVTIKIFTSLEQYTDRMNQLKELDAEENRNQTEIKELLLSISL